MLVVEKEKVEAREVRFLSGSLRLLSCSFPPKNQNAECRLDIEAYQRHQGINALSRIKSDCRSLAQDLPRPNRPGSARAIERPTLPCGWIPRKLISAASARGL